MNVLDDIATGVGYGVIGFLAAAIVAVALRGAVTVCRAAARKITGMRWWSALKVHGWWRAVRLRLGARLLSPALNERAQQHIDNGALTMWPLGLAGDDRDRLIEAKARHAELVALAKFVYAGQGRSE